MTTGQKIQYSLGLENYKQVYIRKISGKEPGVYHIVYDSKLSKTVISNYKIKSLISSRFYSFNEIPNGLDVKKYKFVPITLLSKFDEKLNRRDTFIVTDIAGEYLGDDPERIIINKKLII
jgi:hypothetical protein